MIHENIGPHDSAGPGGGPAQTSALIWPHDRLPEAIVALCRAAGLVRDFAGDLEPAPEKGDLAPWVFAAAARLGVDAEAVDCPLPHLARTLAAAGPALIAVRTKAGGGVLAILSGSRGRVRLLGPDGRIVRRSAADVADLATAAVERLPGREIDRLLAHSGLEGAPARRARRALLDYRLADRLVSNLWLLRPSPVGPILGTARQAGLPALAGAMLVAILALIALEILGWRIIGGAALDGRLDMGWLAGWVLVLATSVPLRFWSGRSTGLLTREIGRILRQRVLEGALAADVDTVRRAGSGHLLAQTMEIHAFEGQAIGGAVAAAFAVIELGVAGWVLAIGAGGGLHVALLALWVAGVLGMSGLYFLRLRGWTGARLKRTHELVERMTGHLTVLAQQDPARGAREADHEVADYLTASTALDRAGARALAGLPGAWLLAAMAVLMTGFAAETPDAAGLAVALGGILLGGRAIGGLAGSLAMIGRAAVSWRAVAPLYHAARAERPCPGAVSTSSDRPATVAADRLAFHHADTARSTLNEVSLTIEPGQRVLLEGSSGSGKSTLAAILAGLRTPQSGRLSAAGLDRSIFGSSWQRQVALVPQFHENYIFEGTLAFNLLLGRGWPASGADLAEAAKVCRDLGLGGLLDRMPGGLSQTVGETGWQLSHGERSRIYLARALLAKAPLTIIDESLTALDPASQAHCLDRMSEGDGAFLLVAHP